MMEAVYKVIDVCQPNIGRTYWLIGVRICSIVLACSSVFGDDFSLSDSAN